MSRGNRARQGEPWLDRVERAGNALPHPVTLFAMALGLVMLLSQVAAWAGWSVRKPAGASGEGELVTAQGLLESDGFCAHAHAGRPEP